MRMILSVAQNCYSVCDRVTETIIRHITFPYLLVFSGRFGCKRDFRPTTKFTTEQNTFPYLLIAYGRFGGACDLLCLTEMLLCL